MNGYAQPSSGGRRFAWAAAAVAASALAVLLLAAPAPEPPAQAAGLVQTPYQVILQVGADPFLYDVPLGGSVTLPISATVTGPQPLAAASVLISYVPAVLRPTACTPRAGGPGGFCNIAYDPANGLVRFNFISQSGVMDAAVLFDLSFEPAAGAVPGVESSVKALVESLADVHGNYMTSRTAGSTVRVVAGAGGGAVVYAGAPEQTTAFHVAPGGTVTVPVWIQPVANLGSASLALAFDPAVVQALACRPIAAAGASGVCALHTGQVQASVLSATGLSGAVLAFEVDLTPAGAAPAGATSLLAVGVEALTDTAGAAIPAGTRPGSVVVDAGSGPVALLRIDPPTQNLYDNAQVTVHLFVDSAAAMRAASWALRYDPLVLQPASCQLTPGWLSGVCNAAGEPGAVRMTVLSSQPLAASVEVAAVVFRRHPEAKGGDKSELTFEVSNFADLNGSLLPYRLQSARISIRDALGATPAVVLRLAGAPPGGFLLPRGRDLQLPITLDIDPLRPVAGLTGNLRYNPAIIRPTRCVWGLAGLADPPLTYCNAQYDRLAGIIRFNLLSAAGVSGSLTPFTVTVEAASGAVDGQTSFLNLEADSATGPAAQPLIWRSQDTMLHLQAPVPAPRVVVGPPELPATAIYTVTLGARATVPLWVEAVPDLGAGTVEVRYDPAVARATRCTLRTDVTPALDGGFCSLLNGIVRMAFVSTAGIDGNAQLCDIEFAQAPDAVGGQTTTLAVVVDNFVNTLEVPLPTSVRSGRLDIGCIALPVTDLRIAQLGADLRLTWTHVGGMTVSYQVWRSATNPYFAFGGSDASLVATVPAPATGAVQHLDVGAAPALADAARYYMVRSMCAAGLGAAVSNRVGRFPYALAPGSLMGLTAR